MFRPTKFMMERIHSAAARCLDKDLVIIRIEGLGRMYVSRRPDLPPEYALLCEIEINEKGNFYLLRRM